MKVKAKVKKTKVETVRTEDDPLAWAAISAALLALVDLPVLGVAFLAQSFYSGLPGEEATAEWLGGIVQDALACLLLALVVATTLTAVLVLRPQKVDRERELSAASSRGEE